MCSKIVVVVVVVVVVVGGVGVGVGVVGCCCCCCCRCCFLREFQQFARLSLKTNPVCTMQLGLENSGS